jgi:phage terminase large subunit-like protein
VSTTPTLDDFLISPESFSREERFSMLARLSPDEIGSVLRILDLHENAPRRRFYCPVPGCDGAPHEGFHWCDHPIDSTDHLPECRHARAAQRPPENDWFVWLFSGGRGTGKTRAGAEWVLDQVWNKGAKRIALVARTPADARDVMIYGDSGIMACSDPHPRPEHEPTKRRLVWPNGAQAFTYSAAAPSQLRGPQHDAAWCDEMAAWPDATKGDSLDTSWNNLMLGLRIGRDPKCFVTTTPKRVKLIRQIMERDTTTTTTDTTYANLVNLAPSFRDQVLAAYEGTRIGRQELYGELLTDVEGALWSLDQIDRLRAEWSS